MNTPVFNVNEYGGIQSSINLAENTGGTVFIPEGLYVSPTLYYKSGMTIAGEGENSIVQLADNTNASLFRNNDPANGNQTIIFDDFHIIGNKANQVNNLGTPEHGIAAYKVGDITIKNMHIEDCGKDAIYLGGEIVDGIASGPSERVNILGNLLETSRRHGMAITSAKDVLVDGNTIQNLDDFGIDIEPNSVIVDYINRITITNNAFYNIGLNPYSGVGTGRAIALQASGKEFETIKIFGNYIYCDYDDGCRGIGSSSPTAHDVEVIGNILDGKINNGFLFTNGSSDVSIIGNKISTSKSWLDYNQGIRLLDNCHDFMIAGNLVAGFYYSISGLVNAPNVLRNITVEDCEVDGYIGFSGGDGLYENITLINNFSIENPVPYPSINTISYQSSKFRDYYFITVFNRKQLNIVNVNSLKLSLEQGALYNLYNTFNYPQEYQSYRYEFNTSPWKVPMSSTKWTLRTPIVSAPYMINPQPSFGSFILEKSPAVSYPTRQPKINIKGNPYAIYGLGGIASLRTRR